MAVGLPHANGIDGALNVVHRVDNRKTFSIQARQTPVLRDEPWAVDVEEAGLRLRLVLEIKKLRDDELAHGTRYGRTQVNNAVVEEEGGNVWGWTNASTVDSLARRPGETHAHASANQTESHGQRGEHRDVRRGPRKSTERIQPRCR